MHAEKYTKVAVAHMLKHYSREHANPESRENINHELTKNNYNLAPERDVSDYDFVKQRLGEVKHLNRDNINIIADWVITLPKDYKGDEEKFFQTAYKGFCSRYGEQNVVSAWVHKDEPQAQPHMHFCFMPVQRTIDKDGQTIEKLNAKAIICRKELREIHPQMEKYLERNGVHAHLLNGKTRDGNKAIEELKREQAIKDFKAVELLRAVQKDMVQPAEPVKNFLGKVAPVPYEKYEHDINTLNAQLLKKENQNRELERQMSWQQYQYRELEKNFNLEHEEHIKLQDKQHDKEYLQRQLMEVGHEQGHIHQKERDITR